MCFKNERKHEKVSTKPLKIRILVSFLTIVVVLSLLIATLGSYVIETEIIDRAQTKVKNDLNFAWEVYRQETQNIENVVRFTALRFFIKDAVLGGDINTLAKRLGDIRKAESLDILTLTDKQGQVIVRSRKPLVTGDSQALDKLISLVLSDQKTISATQIVSSEELSKESSDLARQAYVKFIPTPKARPTSKIEQTSAMCIKAAAPVLDYDGNLIGVLYGGVLLNRNYSIVDNVKDIVYRGLKYKDRDVGTVTIFQGDLRISTNVTDADGQRAIGTRVSEDVYNQVLIKGLPWTDSAFVVNDWYKTAYEPIKDIDGQIIGMLYVGTLEQPFNDIARNTMLMFLAIIAVVTMLAVIFSFVIAGRISRPLTNVLSATERLSAGELGAVVDTKTAVTELNTLAESFNEMSAKLNEREKHLKDLNKNYLDLIGFVSHELKGVLASIVMNVCSVRDKLLGEINGKQQKALEGTIRSLDYLTATVKKFLNLGKIEKGELEAKKTTVEIKKDVFDVVINSLSTIAARKNMTISNKIDVELKVNTDLDLMQIVANNLITNAIKYGLECGNIVLSSSKCNGNIEIEVYNDSVPISQQEKGKLFKRFSRLDNPATKDVKGTGLGLFITQQIIEKHGGKIWVEPRENGNSFIFQLPI